MTTVPQNAVNVPIIEIPDPPEEFGQDGGKFYRAYDTLAEEIDDDMAKSLKEQLDGMLIFVSRKPSIPGPLSFDLSRLVHRRVSLQVSILHSSLSPSLSCRLTPRTIPTLY